MAWFRSNEQYAPEDNFPEEEYDDNLDELDGEEPEPELSPEEIRARRRERARMASTAGNIAGVVGGIVAILVLLTLLFSMISFVLNDFNRGFSLFQTNF